MEGGHAIADVLFGDVKPSGKLPVTFPRRLADSPAHRSERTYPGDGATVHYDEGVFVGYRHFDQEGIQPLFPFGHGLSYTTFDYSELRVSAGPLMADQPLELSFKLTNTGDRAGSEVVQLYVSDRDCPQPRPPRELKRFAKVHLEPGESRGIHFQLAHEDLAYWSEKGSAWVTESTCFSVGIGASSRDIRLQERYRQVN